MATADEQMTVRTIMDLESYDHTAGTALFKQRLSPDHEGTFHSFAMAFTDWDALGRPISISMTFATEESIP